MVWDIIVGYGIWGLDMDRTWSWCMRSGHSVWSMTVVYGAWLSAHHP